jgi:hypothetical protein
MIVNFADDTYPRPQHFLRLVQGMRHMRKSSSPETQAFTCPTCGLDLRGIAGKDGLTIDYDIADWQQRCASAKLGTPCVCPEFRPQLCQMLQRANRQSAR